MKKRFLFLTILLLTASLQAGAIPARGTPMTVRQPDGTEIRIIVSGDEFCKIVRTEDGCAVSLEEDGYVYYASYDFTGAKRITDVRVTPYNRASAAATASRNIPYGMLAGDVAKRRAETNRLRKAHRFQPATKSGTNVKKGIIILAQFDDLKFKYTRDNFVDMITKKGYSYGGAVGSALDYFRDQFEGVADFEFTISPIVTLANGYAYYGENDKLGDDKRAHYAVKEACQLVDDLIDFSQFDCDGDGEADNVFVFVAGPDEAQGASAAHIWSHQWYLTSGGIHLSLDGTRINSYAVSTELSREDGSGKEIFATIGTFCHEYSHALGLMDLYDTDNYDSGGLFSSIGQCTTLMDYGNYNNNGNTPPNYNSMELWSLGLGLAEEFEPGPQTLAPLSSQKRYFVAETDTEGEYYFFECRAPEGWDAFVGGSGMLIYHYDASENDAGNSLKARERWVENLVNCNPGHPCFDMIESVPIAKDIFQAFWPNGTHTSFNAFTNPAMTWWSGGKPEIGITDIRKDGTFVSFNISGPVTIDKVEEFQDAAIVLWSMTGEEDAESCISIRQSGGNAKEYRVRPYAPGSYSYTFEGLSPDKTYTVTVYNPEIPKFSVTSDFTTKKYYSDGYPFIYLNSSERNSDGSFKKGGRMPLRVFNARGAARVSWVFSESVLTTDGSGYYTVQGSGTIKAVVDYEDGSTDVITKQITVK